MWGKGGREGASDQDFAVILVRCDQERLNCSHYHLNTIMQSEIVQLEQANNHLSSRYNFFYKLSSSPGQTCKCSVQSFVFNV